MAYPSDLVRTKDWGTEILTDADLEGQLDLIIDWLDDFADETGGHSHDGTSNEGPQINLANAVSGNLPSANMPDKVVLSATDAVSELTIASGAVTATQSYHTIDTESDASTDDLDTINGGNEGMILIVRAVESARTVVLKDGSGNLKLSGDITLDNAEDTALLIYDGSNWLEVSNSNNGA